MQLSTANFSLPPLIGLLKIQGRLSIENLAFPKTLFNQTSSQSLKIQKKASRFFCSTKITTLVPKRL